MKKEQEFSVGNIVFYPKSIHEMTRCKKNADKEYVAQVDWEHLTTNASMEYP